MSILLLLGPRSGGQQEAVARSVVAGIEKNYRIKINKLFKIAVNIFFNVR